MIVTKLSRVFRASSLTGQGRVRSVSKAKKHTALTRAAFHPFFLPSPIVCASRTEILININFFSQEYSSHCSSRDVKIKIHSILEVSVEVASSRFHVIMLRIYKTALISIIIKITNNYLIFAYRRVVYIWFNRHTRARKSAVLEIPTRQRNLILLVARVTLHNAKTTKRDMHSTGVLWLAS